MHIVFLAIILARPVKQILASHVLVELGVDPHLLFDLLRAWEFIEARVERYPLFFKVLVSASDLLERDLIKGPVAPRLGLEE